MGKETQENDGKKQANEEKNMENTWEHDKINIET